MSGLEPPAPGLDLGGFSAAPSLVHHLNVPGGSGSIGCLSWDCPSESIRTIFFFFFVGHTHSCSTSTLCVLIIFFCSFSQEMPVWQHPGCCSD